MEKIVINGGKQLFGEVTVSGAKNAAVAIIPAVVLCDEACRIENIPNISDVALIATILQGNGRDRAQSRQKYSGHRSETHQHL